MVRLPIKKPDVRCSCVTDMYECGFCRGPKLQRIWNNMSASQRAYDYHVAPAMAAAFDRDRYEEPTGAQSCSCHLSAPCSWCVDQPDPDEETPALPAAAPGTEKPSGFGVDPQQPTEQKARHD